jgi:hypothetical protein
MATVLQPLPPPRKPLPGKAKTPKYDPLPSVWDGEDAELIERMLNFYPRKKPRRILDSTVNGARFWRGSKRAVVGLDIESRHRPNLVGDNTAMPFREGVSMWSCTTHLIFRIKAGTTRRTSEHASV